MYVLIGIRECYPVLTTAFVSTIVAFISLPFGLRAGVIYEALAINAIFGGFVCLGLCLAWWVPFVIVLGVLLAHAMIALGHRRL